MWNGSQATHLNRKYCVFQAKKTVAHYENFPVASFLLPKVYRSAVASLYHFARFADDLADEGEASPELRLSQLSACEEQLALIVAGGTSHEPLFQALAKTYQRYAFPMSLCFDLLSAFKQDVVKVRYESIDSVMDYCRRSANPVGRLLLHIFDEDSPVNLELSDAICTSLQWINFLQDVAIDYQKGRIYFPQAELDAFGVTEKEISLGQCTPAFAALMKAQIDRTRALLQEGAILGRRLPGRIGLEIRLIILGGARILSHLERVNGDVFSASPRLGQRDWMIMLYHALKKTVL